MKKLLMVALLLLTANVALAAGPDPYSVAATTSGVVWNAQTYTANPVKRVLYVSCVDDNFTMKIEKWADGAWSVVRFGTGMENPADEVPVWKNQIVPVVGYFHRITFTTETMDATIQILGYTE